MDCRQQHVRGFQGHIFRGPVQDHERQADVHAQLVVGHPDEGHAGDGEVQFPRRRVAQREEPGIVLALRHTQEGVHAGGHFVDAVERLVAGRADVEAAARDPAVLEQMPVAAPARMSHN